MDFTFVIQHWDIFLAVWIISSIVGAMPTPNGGPVTGTWWYKWLFGTLHAAMGNIPRVLATMFPKVISGLLKKFLGIDIESTPKEKP